MMSTRKNLVYLYSHRFLRFVQKPITLYLILTLANPFPAAKLYATDIVVDPNAPTSQKATLDKAQNGVDVVNVAAPSKAGVSKNDFTDYNVNERGVIINNSTQQGKSQLAGTLSQNRNFKDRSANIVLFDVTGKTPSNINGYTEVFGQRADFILANPNGIQVNGGGFINVPRATLTTGRPQMGDNGQLNGFVVTGGQVSVRGKGVNASGLDYFDIVSRTIKLDGVIGTDGKSATTLGLFTGTNSFDYINRAITQRTDSDGKPQLAIDASVLGSMYAGTIQVVSTEKGVGVNLGNTLAAHQNDITITAAGDVVYKSLQAKQAISVQSDRAITQTNKSIAGSTIQLNAADDITLAGQTQSGQATTIQTNSALINQVNSDVRAVGDLIIKASNVVNKADENGIGILQTEGDLHVTNKEMVENQGWVLQGQTGAAFRAEKEAEADLANLPIDSTDPNHQGQGNDQDDNRDNKDGADSTDSNPNNDATPAPVPIKFGKAFIQSQLLTNTGTIAVDELHLKAEKASNSGVIQAGGSVNISGATLSNSGTIQSGTDLTINTNDQLQNQGSLQSGQDARLTGSVDNTNGLISSQRDFTLSGDLTNENGWMESGRDTTIQANQIANTNGVIQSYNNATLTLNDPNSTINGGQVAAVNQLTVSAQGLSNSADLYGQDVKISTTEGGLRNSGAIQSNATTTLTSADTFQNTGLIQSGTHLGIAAQSDIVNSGAIVAQDASIHTNTNLANQGVLYTDQGLDIAATDITNDGQIDAGNLTITAHALQNSGSTATIQSAQDIAVQATSIQNKDGARMDSGRDINLTATTIQNNDSGDTGGLFAGHDIRLNTDENWNGVSNVNGYMKAENEFVKTGVGHLINDNGNILSGGRSTIYTNELFSNQNGTLKSNGDLALTVRFFNNTNGQIGSDQSILLKGGDFGSTAAGGTSFTNAGTVSAEHNLDVTGYSVENTGLFNANNQLNINAAVFTNHSTGTTRAEGPLNISTLTGSTAGNITNYGTIASNSDVNLLSANDVFNVGSVSGLHNVRVDARIFQNQGISASIKAGQNTNLYLSGQMTNRDGARVDAGRDLYIEAGWGGIHNDNSGNGGLFAGQNIQFVSGAGISNLNGYIQSGAGFSNNSDVNFYNTDGTINAQGAVFFSGGNLHNTRGTISASDLYLNHVYVDNTSGKLHADRNATFTDLSNQNGTVEAGDSLILSFGTNSVNNTGGTIAVTNSGGTLTIDRLYDIANTNGTISSKGNANIDIHTDSNQTGTIAADGVLNFTAHQFTNSGTMSGGSLFNLTTGSILNNGQLSSGGNLNISTTSLTNHGLLYADYNLGITAASLFNDNDIYAANNLNLTASNGMSNQGGTIEAGTDITIAANQISNAYTTRSGWINAGRNMTLTGAVTNQDSILSAGNTLSITGVPGSLTNIRTGLAPISGVFASSLYLNGNVENKDGAAKSIIGNTNSDPNTSGATVFPSDKSMQVADSASPHSGINPLDYFRQSRNNTGLTRVNNPAFLSLVQQFLSTGVNETASSVSFASSSPKGLPTYLIETNVASLDQDKFVGSKYLTDQLGINYTLPNNHAIFLADAFTETRMIREAIMAATGQRYTQKSIHSDTEQMKKLYDNALSQRDRVNLSVGVALSAEQIAQLTQDIIWIEEIIINGQKVLVPKLYLCKLTLDVAKKEASGAKIAGDAIQITGGSLTNDGKILANNTLLADVTTLDNTGGTLKGSKTQVAIEQGDINTTAKNMGTIEGDKLLALEAKNGSIQNTKKLESENIFLKAKKDIKNDSEIAAKDTLVLDAGHDIVNTAAKITAGGDASITAGNDIILDGVTNTTRSTSESSANTTDTTTRGLFGHSATLTTATKTNQTKESSKTEFTGSSISVGGNLDMKAKRDITLKGSTIKTGGSADIEADRDINILAVKETEASTEKKKEEVNRTLNRGGLVDSIFGFGNRATDTESTQTQESMKQSAITSGGTLIVDAGNNINAKSAKLKSGGDMGIFAKNKINLESEKLASDTTAKQNKNNEETTSVTHTETIAKTTLESGGNMIIEGDKGVSMTSAALASQKSLLINSKDGKVESKVIMLDNASVIKGQEDGWNIARIAKTETGVANTISAGNGDIAITAKDDINLAGAKLKSGGNVILESEEGDITLTGIKNSNYRYNHADKTVSGFMHNRVYTYDTENYAESVDRSTVDAANYMAKADNGDIIRQGTTIKADTIHEKGINNKEKTMELLSADRDAYKRSVNLDLGVVKIGDIKKTEDELKKNAKVNEVNENQAIGAIVKDFTGNITLEGSKLKSDLGKVQIKGKSVDLLAVKDNKEETKTHSESSFSGISLYADAKKMQAGVSTSYKGTTDIVHTYDETAKGVDISGQGVQITATDGKITGQSAMINSNMGKLSLKAKDNIDFTEVTEAHTKTVTHSEDTTTVTSYIGNKIAQAAVSAYDATQEAINKRDAGAILTGAAASSETLSQVGQSGASAVTLGFYGGVKVEREHDTLSTTEGVIAGKSSRFISGGGISMESENGDINLTNAQVMNFGTSTKENPTAGLVSFKVDKAAGKNVNLMAGKTQYIDETTHGNTYDAMTYETNFAGYFDVTAEHAQANENTKSTYNQVNNTVIYNANGTTSYEANKLNMAGAESYANVQDLSNVNHLNIESKQDTGKTEDHATNWSASVGVGTGGLHSVGASYGQNHGAGDSAQTKNVSKLVGNQIVGNVQSTTLTAGQIIGNTDNFRTDTLAVNDLKDHDTYASDGFNVGIQYSKGPKASDSSQTVERRKGGSNEGGKNTVSEKGSFSGNAGVSSSGYTKESAAHSYIGTNGGEDGKQGKAADIAKIADTQTGTGKLTKDTADTSIHEVTKDETRNGANMDIDTEKIAKWQNIYNDGHTLVSGDGTKNKDGSDKSMIDNAKTVINNKNGYVGGTIADTQEKIDATKELPRNLAETTEVIREEAEKNLGMAGTVLTIPTQLYEGTYFTFNELKDDPEGSRAFAVNPDTGKTEVVTDVASKQAYVVNGINVTETDIQTTFEQNGNPTNVVYRENPTHGIFGDLIESGFGKVANATGTEEVIAMNRIVAEDMHDRENIKGAKNTFHSQGTIIGEGAMNLYEKTYQQGTDLNGNTLPNGPSQINKTQKFRAIGPAVTEDSWINSIKKLQLTYSPKDYGHDPLDPVRYVTAPVKFSDIFKGGKLFGQDFVNIARGRKNDLNLSRHSINNPAYLPSTLNSMSSKQPQGATK